MFTIQTFFNEENAFKYVFWQMAFILCQPQCVRHISEMLLHRHWSNGTVIPLPMEQRRETWHYSLMIVYSNVYSGTGQLKHKRSASLAFVRGIHRWPSNSLHKGPATRKMFPFDDVIMDYQPHGSIEGWWYKKDKHAKNSYPQVIGDTAYPNAETFLNLSSEEHYIGLP